MSDSWYPRLWRSGETHKSDTRLSLERPWAGVVGVSLYRTVRHLIVVMLQFLMRGPAFPVELVMDSPALASGDPLVLGATLRLLVVFWQSGCQPLPSTETGLALLARCHYPRRWCRVRSHVKAALSETIPRLLSAYPERRRAWLAKQEKARKAGRASAAARGLQVRPVGGGNELSSNVRNAGGLLGASLNISRETSDQLPHASLVRPRGGAGLLTDR